MKTLVLVNTLTQVHGFAYSSHCMEWFHMGRDFPEDNFIIFNPQRTGIDQARNSAVELALRTESDYVYFIDDDMILTPHTYKALRSSDKDITMAESIIRGYPYRNMYFIDPSDKGFESEKEYCDSLEYFQDSSSYIDESSRLVRVDAIGCATVLFQTRVFRDIEPPWFATVGNMTEDVYFCLKAQRHFGRRNIGIYVHTGVPTAHILDAEVVHPKNRDTIFKRAEEDNPYLRNLNGENRNGDRGTEYARQVENRFCERSEQTADLEPRLWD